MSKERYLHKCLRCGWEWFSSQVKPKTCPNPKCRSAYWDREKINKG